MNRKKKQPPIALFAVVGIIIVLFIVCAVYLVKQYSPSKEKADLYQVYQVEGEEAALILNREFQKDLKGRMIDGKAYISTDLLYSGFNSRFYWNAAEGRLFYTLPEETVIVHAGDTSYTKGGNVENMEAPIVVVQGETAYVLLDYVNRFTDMHASVYTDPARIFVTFGAMEETYATVKSPAEVRYRGGVKSEVLTTVEKGMTVVVLDELEKWSHVITQDGHIGYISRKELKDYHTAALQSNFTAPVYTNIAREKEICLVWHQVFNRGANEKLSALMAGTKGVTVVSPTWLSLSDNQGNLTSLSSASYVEEAHNMGLEVWILVDDFSLDVDKLALFSNTEARNRLADNLIAEANAVGADGINIDFEGIKKDVGPHYVQFLRELSVVCRKEGLVLSVDNYVPSNGRSHYDLEEQGQVVDYVIMMGYDEYWKGSTEAGPNASFPFVERGLNKLVEMVPKEKVINAIPFFTRIWKETNGELSSEASGMGTPLKLFEENDVEPEWLTELGLSYGEYKDGDSLVRIWNEDVRSIEEKMALVRQLELAGVACWKLGLETPDVWDVIPNYLN